MKTKFTRGPWKHDKTVYPLVCSECSSEFEDGSIGEIRNSTNVGIATVLGMNWKTETNNERAFANADLIAAAPELYEALEEFTKMFPDTVKYPDPETITTGLRILLPKAQAALKKARGEK